MKNKIFEQLLFRGKLIAALGLRGLGYNIGAMFFPYKNCKDNCVPQAGQSPAWFFNFLFSLIKRQFKWFN